MLTAAIRLYYVKSDVEERTFRPIVREETEPLDRDRAPVRRLGDAARAAARPDGARRCGIRRRPDETLEVCKMNAETP